MKITQRQLRQIIKEELMREMRRHIGPVRGATFHVDPETGEYVTGGEDFEGPGGRLAHAVRRPTIKGMKSPAQLAMDPIMTDFGDPNEPDPDFDDYSYGDDPDEFMDLPAGEIMRRMRR